MTDQDHANAVAQKVAELTAALDAAKAVGLSVILSVDGTIRAKLSRVYEPQSDTALCL